MEGSRPTASPMTLSPEILTQVLTRIGELESQLSTQADAIQQQAETIRRQAKQIEGLETKSLVLRANQDGIEFVLFSRLPPELRRMIWKHALPHGQVVEVQFNPRKFKQTFGKYDKLPSASVTFDTHFPTPYTPSYKPSALLRTCRESRIVAKAVYERCFAYNTAKNTLCSGSIFPFDAVADSHPLPREILQNVGIFVQPQRDTIFISDRAYKDGGFLSALDHHYNNGFQFGNIERLIIYLDPYGKVLPTFSRWFDEINLRNLKELIIVDSPHASRWPRGVFVYPTMHHFHDSFKADMRRAFETCAGIKAPKVEFITEAQLQALL